MPLLALLAVLPLSGCRSLCEGTVGVFCPETLANPLNDPPDALFGVEPQGGRRQSPIGLTIIETNQDVVFDSDSTDRNGDDLYLEWDLDGDGRFELEGYRSAFDEVETRYRDAGRRRVRLRVTDFPTRLGAPGESIHEQDVYVADRASNRPPQAVLTARPNPVVAGEEVVFDAGGSSDPDDYDQGGLRAAWAFEATGSEFHPSTGGLRESRRFYQEGTQNVKVLVHDLYGAEDIAEVRVEVVGGRSENRPPVASFVARPNPVEAGEEVTYDASASSDPDGDALSYCWDTDGNPDEDHLVCSGGDPVHRPPGRFSPGEWPIRLVVSDSATTAEATITLRVVPRSEENIAPTARFTVTPSAPETGTPVTFDASDSSDPEGPIARFEWDLDSNGSFETDREDQSVVVTSYDTPGERFVRLRVTDAAGATAITGRTVNVRPPAARAFAAAVLDGFQSPVPARPSLRSPFSARVSGSPLPGTRGKRRRRGARLALLGVLGRGRLRARLLAPPGRATRSERALRRLLNAPWRVRVGFGYDRRSSRWTATGIALAGARRSAGGAACLRLVLKGRAGRHPTGRVRLLGGTGAAAKLHGSAEFRFMLATKDGSATVVGQLEARTGSKRPLPRACRRLQQGRGR